MQTNTYWPNEFDTFMNHETDVTEDYYTKSYPRTILELKKLFIDTVTGYRDNKTKYLTIDGREFDLTQNSERVILRKLNSPLKNFTLISEYSYTWDDKQRIDNYFNDIEKF